MKKIGILPSLVTLGNLACGFAAIGVIAQAQVYWRADPANVARGLASFALAGQLILLAMVFDAMDGKIARITRATTEFGAQLDSLCDMVTFGVAPAFIVFVECASRDLFGHYRYAWVAATLYAVCAALRLARFNVETKPDEDSHLYFSGLPSPAAAGVIACMAVFDAKLGESTLMIARSMPFVVVVLAGLMVSKIRYVHLLTVLFRERRPFTYLVLLVFALVTIVALWEHYEYILLVGFGAYVLSGPATFPWAFARHRRAVRAKILAEAGDDTDLDLTDEDSSLF